jgi:chemosensory pili system protein ChpA (sensor histidine kinase/response regulator)
VTTVLVVDDEFDAREILSVLLESKGYRVVTAKDGVEALEVLATAKPDAMVLDLMMPVLGGEGVLARREASPAWSRIPVILTSAADAEPIARRYGVRSVPKPYDLDVLVAQLHEAVNGAQR